MAVDTNAVTSLRVANGAALAAVLGAGIGSFAMGVFVLANEAGVFTAPSLYGPAGGLSGRSTFAAIAWLAAWGMLHARWRNRNVAPVPVAFWTLLLVGLAVVATFPPVWGIF
ncbi:MAG: hypothetical protein IT183_08955 [Acidobacteria bacterium]|nr:hypothetical protein [Acidobacteriota bacterium]